MTSVQKNLLVELFVEELPHTPTGRLAKHRLPSERTPGEMDFESPA